MNNSAFTFQTLHPDTIMDALFEQGIRVDSGLTPLNSYENRVYQFQDEDRDVLSSNFIALNVGQPIKSSKNINLRCSW
nr:Unknown Function [uncultured bacterium]